MVGKFAVCATLVLSVCCALGDVVDLSSAEMRQGASASQAAPPQHRSTDPAASPTTQRPNNVRVAEKQHAVGRVDSSTPTKREQSWHDVALKVHTDHPAHKESSSWAHAVDHVMRGNERRLPKHKPMKQVSSFHRKSKQHPEAGKILSKIVAMRHDEQEAAKKKLKKDEKIEENVEGKLKALRLQSTEHISEHRIDVANRQKQYDQAADEVRKDAVQRIKDESTAADDEMKVGVFPGGVQ